MIEIKISERLNQLLTDYAEVLYDRNGNNCEFRDFCDQHSEYVNNLFYLSAKEIIATLAEVFDNV